MLPISTQIWIRKDRNLPTVKEHIFDELYNECRSAAPGARLSYNIRNKLERFPKEIRQEIVSHLKEGCAPLFLACKKGNVEIVEYLITECGSDVEQKGMYEVIDDRSVHHVTPLWCASVAGKLSVVKCLVEHGADVDCISDTGSTPVRSACFMTHYDIVMYLVKHNANILKPNYNGGTCLINSVQSVPLCDFLIHNGADVNAQDIQFKTALHYAIQEHRFETTKLLLEHGADPFIRSRYGDDALQTACLKGAVHVFDYLSEKYTYSVERIAEAHELLGTTFVDEHHDTQKALHHWHKALELRYVNPSSPLLKPVRTPLSISSRKFAYANHVEFSTIEELNNFSSDLDGMRIQSLLICERILGPLHRDTIFRLMYRGAAYADSLQYQRCIDLWRYALDLRIRKDGLLHSEVCFAAQALVRLFLDLFEKSSAGMIQEQLRFEDVLVAVQLITNQLAVSAQLLSVKPEYKRQLDNFDKVLKILAHLLYILISVPNSAVEMLSARQIIKEILLIQPRTSLGDTLLHMVVSKATMMKTTTFFEDPHTSIFPNFNLAKILVECGAHIEAIDVNLNSPLHIASLADNFTPTIVELLLRHGAHIDRRNASGHHPHKMLAELNDSTINPLHYVSLKCLAARIVISENIPYRSEVPTDLVGFVSIH